VSDNRGYKTLWTTAPPTPLLSPYAHGQDLPGGDRGAVLRQAQQTRPTDLQRQNALTAGGQAGWGVTLPAAAPGLALAFTNADTVPISIWPLPSADAFAPADDRRRHFGDTIDESTAAYVLAAGASVTCTAQRGSWTAA
jgi:hypothetical protein